MSFVEAFRCGQAEAEEIDAWVMEWRRASIGSPAAKVDLHEYLGMTWDQYRHWAATGEIPTF